MTPNVIGDPGGFVEQPLAPETPAPAQVIVINAPKTEANPWASPTAFRPSTDQFIDSNAHPALRYMNAPQNGSQYAPTVVAPAGTPKYTHGPIMAPVPAVAGKNSGVQ